MLIYKYKMNSFTNEKLSILSNMMNNNSSSPKYICHNDLVYFKNELLKDLKTIESKLILKIDSSKKEFENKILNIENKYDSLKYKMLANTNTEKDYGIICSEKINKLFIFNENIEDKIFIHEKKLKEINDYLRETLYSFNKILQDSVLCPGIIGNNSKFSTFQKLIEYLLSNINILNSFKEKITILDIENYKNKLDRLTQTIKIRIDNFVDSSKKLTTNSLITFENKRIELYNTIDNKLIEAKNNLEYKINSINEKIDDQNNLIYNIKNEIMHKINKNILENNNSFNNINLKFEKYLNEIDEFNVKIKTINQDLEEKMKDHESNLTIKMNHSYNIIIEFNKKFKSLTLNDEIYNINSTLDKEYEKSNINLIENKELDIPSIQLKSSKSVGNILEKYFNGEIGLNQFQQSTKNKKIKRKTEKTNNIYKDDNNLENNSIDYLKNNFNNINEKFSFFKNIKYIKLNNKNEISSNSQDYFKNRFLIKKNKIDKAIIDNENKILNNIPRKEIIKTLLMGNNEPFTCYLMKGKNDRKNPKIKLNNSSKISRTKNHFLLKGKSEINVIPKRFRNNSAYHFNKRDLPNDLFNTGEDIKYLSNGEINNYHEIDKKGLSSLVKISRNLDNNINLIHNYTDILKNNSKIIQNSPLNENLENKKSFENNENNIKNLNSSEPIIYNINSKNNFGLNNKNKVNIKLRIVKKDTSHKLGSIKKGKDNIKSSYFYLDNKIIKNK